MWNLKNKHITFILLISISAIFIIIINKSDFWIGRAILSLAFILALNIFIFWLSISKKSNLIEQKSKLSLDKYNKIRPRVEQILRVFFFLLGVGIFFNFTRDITVDLYDVATKDGPSEIESTVTDVTIPIFGLWFINQTITLKHSKENYYVLFSLHHIKEKREYKFKILKKSRIIIYEENI